MKSFLRKVAVMIIAGLIAVILGLMLSEAILINDSVLVEHTPTQDYDFGCYQHNCVA